MRALRGSEFDKLWQSHQISPGHAVKLLGSPVCSSDRVLNGSGTWWLLRDRQSERLNFAPRLLSVQFSPPLRNLRPVKRVHTTRYLQPHSFDCPGWHSVSSLNCVINLCDFIYSSWAFQNWKSFNLFFFLNLWYFFLINLDACGQYEDVFVHTLFLYSHELRIGTASQVTAKVIISQLLFSWQVGVTNL